MTWRRLLAGCGDWLRSAGVAVVVGIIFAAISIGQREKLTNVFVVGAVTGLLIWICIWLLQTLFHDVMHARPERHRPFYAALIYLVGGLAGWTAGVLLSARILGERATLSDLVTGVGPLFMVITGGIAVAIGLVFRWMSIMRDRLSATMERLKEREWAEKELALARSIQTRLLPPQKIEGNGFSIAARNFPAHVVAGDFYDVVHLDDGSIAVIVADVAGKGMGASLIMASVKAVLPFVGRGSVDEAMTALNEKLVHELDRREFVALAYARYFPADGTLHLANAGFPDPYLLRNGSVQTLSVTGQRLPLGIRSNVHYDTYTTKLQTNDRLVFVSDGIPEAPTGNDQPYGYDRLADALRDGTSAVADDWLSEFLARIRKEVLEPLDDDWTALVLQRA